MKSKVRYQDKEYEVHAHASQLVGNDLVEDYISKYIAGGHFYEEPLLTYLHSCYGTFKRVVDAGANIGNHSKFFTEVMGAEVWAFEPQPDSFRLLEKNNPTGHNYNVALGSQEKKVGLATFPHNMGMTNVTEGTTTKMITLDSLNLAPELIKIDVEGMEAHVVKGAMNTIARYRPLLVVEHNDIRALYDTARLLHGFNYLIEVFPIQNWEVFIYQPQYND